MSAITTIGIGILGFIGLTVALNYGYKKKLRKLANSRPVLSKEDYVDQFVREGYDRRAVETIYDEIRAWLNEQWFSPYPNDDFVEDYQIDTYDIEQWVERTQKKLGINESDRDFENSIQLIFNNESVRTYELLNYISNKKTHNNLS